MMHRQTKIRQMEPPDHHDFVLPQRASDVTYAWLSEDDSGPDEPATLLGAFLLFCWELFLLAFRVLWFLVKWALIIAFYVAVFGFFLILFGTLFAM